MVVTHVKGSYRQLSKLNLDVFVMHILVVALSACQNVPQLWIRTSHAMRDRKVCVIADINICHVSTSLVAKAAEIMDKECGNDVARVVVCGWHLEFDCMKMLGGEPQPAQNVLCQLTSAGIQYQH